MVEPQEVQTLVLKLVDSTFSRTELNRFIRFCAACSAAYLESRRRCGKLKMEYLGNGNTEIEQLALDAVAELFATNGHKTFPELHRYFEPLRSEWERDEDQAFFMTRRWVVSHTRQFLAKRMSQNDPVGAKIFRNLALVPKRVPAVQLIAYGDSDYFFYQDPNVASDFPGDFHPERPEISGEFAIALLKRCGGNKAFSSGLPPLVTQFLIELQQESQFRRFINRYTLFYLLRSTLGFQVVELDEERARSSGMVVPDQRVFEKAPREYLAFIKNKFRRDIQSRYVVNQKISPSMQVAYCQILDPYFEDLLLDGTPRKMPEYRAATALIQVEDQEWKLHLGRLEYLIRLAREALQAKFRLEFLNSG